MDYFELEANETQEMPKKKPSQSIPCLSEIETSEKGLFPKEP